MSVGAAAGGFPLTNLKLDSKQKTFRSTNLSSPKIKTTWAEGQTISGVALAFTNLIAGSTFRTTLYDDPTAGTLLYDSTAITISEGYDAPAGFSTIGSAAFAYGGGAHASIFFGAVSGVKRMEIELTSAGNADGYVEIGRIIAGQAWQPEKSAEYGAQIGFADTTTGLRTSSGNLTTDRGTISRTMEFDMQYMSQADKAALNNIFRFSGKSQPVFINLIPSAPLTEADLSQQIYGKIDTDLTVTLPFYGVYNSKIKIIEI